jgi:hypothetical protein
MYKYLLCTLAFGVIVSSCQNKKSTASTYTERLEIYDAKGDSSGYTKHALVYIEIATYVDSIKSKTEFLNPDNTSKGKELVTMNKDGQPEGSEYYGANDTLLSYYKFVYDNNGKKVSSTAFDAANNEVLRMEKYAYDGNNFLSQKDIFDANNVLNRRYIFTNDIYGNLTQMSILNGNLEEIAIETYKIIQYDDQKKWTQKWGFINDEPKTYHQRTFNQ